MTAEPQVSAEPTVLEYGRYRLSRSPDGRGVIARAVGTCESCQHCGCGEQADLIWLPSVVVKKMLGEPVGPAEMMGLLAEAGGPGGLMKGLMGRG